MGWFGELFKKRNSSNLDRNSGSSSSSSFGLAHEDKDRETLLAELETYAQKYYDLDVELTQLMEGSQSDASTKESRINDEREYRRLFFDEIEPRLDILKTKHSIQINYLKLLSSDPQEQRVHIVTKEEEKEYKKSFAQDSIWVGSPAPPSKQNLSGNNDWIHTIGSIPPPAMFSSKHRTVPPRPPAKEKIKKIFQPLPALDESPEDQRIPEDMNVSLIPFAASRAATPVTNSQSHQISFANDELPDEYKSETNDWIDTIGSIPPPAMFSDDFLNEDEVDTTTPPPELKIIETTFRPISPALNELEKNAHIARSVNASPIPFALSRTSTPVTNAQIFEISLANDSLDSAIGISGPDEFLNEDEVDTIHSPLESKDHTQILFRPLSPELDTDAQTPPPAEGINDSGCMSEHASPVALKDNQKEDNIRSSAIYPSRIPRRVIPQTLMPLLPEEKNEQPLPEKIAKRPQEKESLSRRFYREDVQSTKWLNQKPYTRNISLVNLDARISLARKIYASEIQKHILADTRPSITERNFLGAETGEGIRKFYTQGSESEFMTALKKYTHEIKQSIKGGISDKKCQSAHKIAQNSSHTGVSTDIKDAKASIRQLHTVKR